MFPPASSEFGDVQPEAPLASNGLLLIVGGYGLVGAKAAQLLRRRHPDLRLMLAGRRPQMARRLAVQIDASTARVDVRAARPLAGLAERPSAILAAVSDPDDRLLLDAIRRGIPIADINRGGHADILDVAVHVARERPTAAVLLSGSWISGMTALTAAAVARQVTRPDRIDITVLVSSADRVGPDSWGFNKRWAWPFHVTEDGRRRPVEPLTGVRRVRCADGGIRPAVRVGTLEQITLPITLDVPTVETRMALNSEPVLWALVGLKRSRALRALERRSLQGFRSALLQRSGTGDLAGFSVRASRGKRSAGVDVIDVRGQSHLNAVGAANAAERVLGLTGSALPAGISFPEQSARRDVDLASLAEAGAIVRLSGFERRGTAGVQSPARYGSGPDVELTMEVSGT